MAKNKEVKVILTAEERYKRKLGEARKDFMGLGKQISGAFKAAAGAFVIRGIGRALKSAVGDAANFAHEMAKVSTMVDDIGVMDKFTDSVKSMSVEFGQSKDVLAKGLFDILSSGIGAADALDVLRVASKAAIGGVTDTAVAVDGMTTVMNAYQLGAESAEHVSDLMFNTVKEGKIEFAELAQFIGQVAPTAKVAGVEIEQLFAAISTAVKVEKPRLAMTKIRKVIVESAKAGKDLGQVLKELAGADLRTILGADLSDEAAGGVALLAGNYQLFLEQVEKAENVAGKASAAFDKMNTTQLSSMKRIEQQWGNIKISVGEYLSEVYRIPTLMSEIEALTGGVERAEERLQRIREKGVNQKRQKKEKEDAKFQIAHLKEIAELSRKFPSGAVTIGTIAFGDEIAEARARRLAKMAKDAEEDAKSRIATDKLFAQISKEASDEALKTLDEQIRRQTLLNEGKDRQAFIERQISSAQADARKEGGNLSKEDAARVTERAGQAFDTVEKGRRKDRTVLQDLQREIAMQKLLNEGKEKEVFVQERLNAAKRDQVRISEEELRKIRTTAEQLFDMQNEAGPGFDQVNPTLAQDVRSLSGFSGASSTPEKTEKNTKDTADSVKRLEEAAAAAPAEIGAAVAEALATVITAAEV